MAAKAVVIFVNGQPFPNAEVSFCLASGTERKWPLTNQDGYTILQDMPPASGYVKVIANSFKSYLQVVTLDLDNQTIRIGNSAQQPNDIVLPALSFNKPSRDRIINVKANLCNIDDAMGLPIFEPFINQLILSDINRAYDWCARLKDNGSTHITTDITGDYDEFLPWLDSRYPIPGGDYTNNLDDYKRILDFLLAQSLIPIVKSGADGHSYQPGGMTYGWSWGMQMLPGIYDKLKDYHDQCLWSTGYDGCFPDWLATELLAFLKMMRDSLGDNQIDTEFAGPGSIGYCHLGNGEADWADDKLGMLDCFSTELQTNPAQFDGIAQTATRLLGPDARNCPSTPYYLINTTKKINMCFYETVAYWAIRKYLSYDELIAPSQLGQYYGFQSFGNGIPK